MDDPKFILCGSGDSGCIRSSLPSVAEVAVCAAGVAVQQASEPPSDPAISLNAVCGPCSNVILYDRLDEVDDSASGTLPADTTISPEAMLFVSDQLESESSREAFAFPEATYFVSDQLESEDPCCDNGGESPKRRPRPPSSREHTHGDEATLSVTSVPEHEVDDRTHAPSIPLLPGVATTEQLSVNASPGGSADRNVNRSLSIP